MRNVSTNLDNVVKTVLFNAASQEGRELAVYLNTYEDGRQDLLLPYNAVAGTLGRAMELLAHQGLGVDVKSAESWPTATYYIVGPIQATAVTPVLEEAVAGLRLVRTGRMVAFLELHIGEAFYYKDAFWTRTDTYAGTDLRPRGRKLAPPPYGNTFGSCSFGIEPDTLTVEEVELQFDRPA